MTRLPLALTLCLVCAGACAVQPKPLPPRVNGSAGGGASEGNLFAPVAIRIHPLTRLVSGEGGDAATSIEAHLELVDAAGDTVKGAGALVLELYRGAGPVRGSGQEGQVQRWTLDLSDLETNSQAYDRVTLTYRVVLTGGPAFFNDPEGLTLRVRMTTLGGRQLSDEAELGW